jgi:hypothetical protein
MGKLYLREWHDELLLRGHCFLGAFNRECGLAESNPSYLAEIHSGSPACAENAYADKP